MKYQTPLLIIFTGLLFCLTACAPKSSQETYSTPKNPPQNRLDILTINEKPEKSPYQLEWGDVVLELRKHANPNVYGGLVEIDLNTFRDILDQEIRLVKEDKVLASELILISRPPFSRNNPMWFNYPHLAGGQLAPKLQKKFRDNIQEGDQVFLRLFSEIDSISVHPALITIKDPFGPYQPQMDIYRDRRPGNVYGFQLIQLKDRRPVLRIDTSAEATRHIYELYQQDEQYLIWHVPGFETRRRLITEKDYLFPTKTVHRSELLGQPHDVWALSEFTDYADKEVTLKWGGLEASPSGPPFSLKKFQENCQTPFELKVDGEKLDIISFHLYLLEKDQFPERYLTEDLYHHSLIKRLYRLRPASSIFLTNLVVKDYLGRILLLPIDFAFHIEAEQPYYLQFCDSELSDSRTDNGFFANQGVRIEYQNAPLDDVIIGLVSPQSGAIWFGERDYPNIDLEFHTDQLSMEESKVLVMRKLREAYNLSVEWPVAEDPVYELQIVDQPLFQQHFIAEMSQAEEDKKLDDKLRLVALKDISLMLNNGLPETIIHQTSLNASGFIYFEEELDLQNLASAQASLQQYGLDLQIHTAAIGLIIR